MTTTHYALAILCALCAGCSSEKNARPVNPGSDVPKPVSTEALRHSDDVPFTTNPGGGFATRDGLFAFVDVAQQSIVVFDSTGRRRESLGRRGQGPGEFQHLEAAFALPGDTLAGFDRMTQSITLFHAGIVVGESVRFVGWRTVTDATMKLVGRFNDGRWVAVPSINRSVRGVGLRFATDTPSLVVGNANAVPAHLIQLQPRTVLDLVTTRAGFQPSISADVSPGIGAVCDAGVVTVDTTGVRYFDKNGKVVASFPIPVSRDALSRSFRAGIVQSALIGMPAGAEHDRVKQFFDDQISRVDSALNQPMLDSEGRAWLTSRTKAGTVFIRFDKKGVSDGTFQLRAPAVITRTSLVSLMPDSLDENAFRIFRIAPPKSAAPPAMGWCSAPFRY